MRGRGYGGRNEVKRGEEGERGSGEERAEGWGQEEGRGRKERERKGRRRKEKCMLFQYPVYPTEFNRVQTDNNTTTI